MEGFFRLILQFLMFAWIIIIAIYIALAIFLNKLNKLVYGKGTAMAWIPIVNFYLLGKLTINKIVGWVLVICLFLMGSYTTTVNGESKTYTILPENISSVVLVIFGLAVSILIIYAIVKYFGLKEENKNSSQVSSQPNTQSAVNVQPPMEQSVQPAVNVQPPVEQPVQPTVSVQQPTEQPVQPTVSVQQPVEQPVQPAVNAQPIEQSVQPAVNVQQPTEQPVQPTVSVQQPTEQPVQPAVNAQPIEQPVQPPVGQPQTPQSVLGGQPVDQNSVNSNNF